MSFAWYQGKKENSECVRKGRISVCIEISNDWEKFKFKYQCLWMKRLFKSTQV